MSKDYIVEGDSWQISAIPQWRNADGLRIRMCKYCGKYGCYYVLVFLYK